MRAAQPRPFDHQRRKSPVRSRGIGKGSRVRILILDVLSRSAVRLSIARARVFLPFLPSAIRCSPILPSSRSFPPALSLLRPANHRSSSSAFFPRVKFSRFTFITVLRSNRGSFSVRPRAWTVDRSYLMYGTPPSVRRVGTLSGVALAGKPS